MSRRRTKRYCPSLAEITINGLLAGMAIALAGYASAIAGSPLLKAIVFPAGLLLIVLAGFHLFTGNIYSFARYAHVKPFWYIVMLIWNWGMNFAGAALTAVALNFIGAPVAASIVPLAVAKCATDWGVLLTSGLMCNILVCFAVALSHKHEGILKALAVFIPIFLFVICGFEHSVANMFYLEYGMINGAAITVRDIFNQLVPVTIGNIFGGLFVWIYAEFQWGPVR